MTRTGRRIATLGTLLAVMVAGTAAYLYTSRTAFNGGEVQALQGGAIAIDAAVSGSASASAMPIDNMQSALLTEKDHPAGTTFQNIPMTPDSLNASNAAMVVTPEACLGALKLALGSASSKVTGWMQVGSRPIGENRFPFENAVAKVDGGLNLTRLRSVVGTCKSGTVTWPEMKLSATISLSDAGAPVVRGATTYAYQSTMTYTNVTTEQLQALAVCGPDVPVEPAPPGTVADASFKCISTGAAPGQPMNFTVTQYIGYATANSAYVEACAESFQATEAMLAVPFARLQQAGFVN